uniref:EOG090X091L n=1 Tax=Alona affinis TaxID=381656 RepID=A0A9N6ZEV1_9CRUS|nr:EOG090X091L [Alona affinis]
MLQRIIKRNLPLCYFNNLSQRSNWLHSSPACPAYGGYGQFWESHPKGKYAKPNNKPKVERIREGLKELKKEIQIWKNEVVEAAQMDPILAMPLPGDVDVLWKFDSSMKFDDIWITTSDQDHEEGFSSCSLKISPTGKGLFSGEVCTRIPKDGKVPRSGYCNMRSMRPMKSFKRDSFYDWTGYTHLVLRVRGDGRSYMVNLGSAGYFDVNWNDIYHFPLYTRGGPHWQVTRIPFSKFFFASKGRIQDNFHEIPLCMITNFGITAADKINAPFRLELDYVGLEYDPSHTEESAYETYRFDSIKRYAENNDDFTCSASVVRMRSFLLSIWKHFCPQCPGRISMLS